MLTMYRLFTYILLILCFTCVNNVKSEDCEQLLKTTDHCLRKIIYIGDKDIKFVKTEKELTDHCKGLEQHYKCARNFRRCLRLFPKQVFTMLIRSGRKLIKDRCESSDGRKEFLHHTQCFSKPEVYDFNRCLDKSSIILHYISANATPSELIPSLCCTFYDAIDCLKRKGDQYCIHKTGPHTGDYVSNTAKVLLNDVIEVTCGQRKSLEDCRRLEPKWIEIFEKLSTPFEKIKPQKLGLFYPMIKVAKRLDSGN